MTAQAIIQHTVLGLEGLAVKPRQAQSNVVNVHLHPDLGSPRTILNVEERRPRCGETPRLTSISLLHIMSGILRFRQICCCQNKPAEFSGGPNFTFMKSGPGKERTNGVLGWANPRTYIYNRDISVRDFSAYLKVSDAGQAQGGEDLLPPHRLHTPPQCDEVEGGCWCFHTLCDFSGIVQTEKWP